MSSIWQYRLHTHFWPCSSLFLLLMIFILCILLCCLCADPKHLPLLLLQLDIFFNLHWFASPILRIHRQIFLAYNLDLQNNLLQLLGRQRKVELADTSIPVSSHDFLQFFITCWMYILNNVGDRQNPCFSHFMTLYGSIM